METKSETTWETDWETKSEPNWETKSETKSERKSETKSEPKSETKSTLSIVWHCTKIYLLWILVHFVSANLYTYLCAHLSWWGFFTSPFLTQTPHCKALLWLLTTSVFNIGEMWKILASTCVGFYFIKKE